MRTVIGFTILAALCVAGAWWVAGLPGAVSASFAGTTIETSAPVALTLLTLLFLAIYIVIRVLASVWNAPKVMGRWRRDRNRLKGDAAVTRTLVALAAADGGAARREAERSRRLLGDTPLTLLLAANASRQAGREDEAAEVFKRLAARPDGKLLGIRGLLRQAVARRDWPEATRLAEQAEAAHPGAAWLTEERRVLALQTGQYRQALRLMGPPGRRNTTDPGARAALGVAAANEETDAKAALQQAKQAFETEPSLAPAAVGYATRLRDGGRERSALDVLRRTWSLAPQPDVAEAFLAPHQDPAARYKAAAALVSANPGLPDSALLLARLAMDAGQFDDAVRHAQAARTAGVADRRVWLLLADLAEHGHGDPQEALRHILSADAGPAWRCVNCGTHHSEWHPVCDACGVPGKIKWLKDSATAPAPRAAVPAIEGLG